MRENGREEENRENWSSFAPKVYSLDKKSLITVCTIGLYSHQDKQNYQNQQKQLTVTRTKWEEIKRGTKRQNFKRAAGTVCEK